METNNTLNDLVEMNFDAQEDVEKYLIEKCGAERIIWIDTTSSAGNWSGLIVKKVGEDQYDLIEFFQEIEFGGPLTITVEKSIVKYPVPEDFIDTAIEMYLGYYEEDSAFEEDDDFEEVVKQNNKKNGGTKMLEFF